MQTASTPALAAEKPRVTTLPNGLSILVQEDDRFPLASLRLYVHAGSAYETPKQAGISHLLEHMVFKGTHKRGPGQVAKDVESVGGSMNAATSFDYTVYYTDMPAAQWALGMDVLHDMTFGAAIDPEELEREKNVVLAELKRNEDNPDSLLFKRMQPLVWPGTTYDRPIIGFEDVVKSITRQDILDYIKTFYQPQSMLLVVVGKVKTDEVVKEATRLFGDLKNDHDISPVAPFDLAAIHQAQRQLPRVSVIPGDWNKVYLSLSFPVPGFRSSQIPSLEVLAQLLGGDNTSRLYRKFKYERQLVHNISAYSMTLERAGIMYIQTTLDRDKLDIFWKEFIQELSSLNAASFTDQELERAKLNLEDSLFQAKETLPGLASKLGFFQFFEDGILSEQNYLYELKHVDRGQLDQAIHDFIRPSSFSAVLLPPQKDTDAKMLGEELTAQLAELWPAKIEKSSIADAKQAGKGRNVIDLGKGRTLVLLPDPTLPYTSISMSFRGGDSLLSPDEQGLAQLGARTLTKGTAKRSANELQDFLSDHAASLNASSTRETMVVNAKFPTRFSDQLLPLFKEVLTQPAFAQDEVERERQNQVASIKGREDQPLGLAFRNIFPFLFKDAPYSYLHQGKPEQVLTFSADSVRKYWGKQSTAPWTMAVCGDFDMGAVQALAKDLAATMDNGEMERDIAFTTPQWNDKRSEDLHLPDRNQTHILQVFKTPPMDSADIAGLKLLRAILAGQSGILFNELRDKQGLGYSVTAMLWQSPATGFMAFYIGTYPDKADQALEGFNKVVSDLRENLLPEEALERGKSLLEGEYYQDHQSLSSRSREAASLNTLGLPLDNNRSDIERARALSAEDLRELARKYLNPGTSYLMRVTPEKQ